MGGTGAPVMSQNGMGVLPWTMKTELTTTGRQGRPLRCLGARLRIRREEEAQSLLVAGTTVALQYLFTYE